MPILRLTPVTSATGRVATGRVRFSFNSDLSILAVFKDQSMHVAKVYPYQWTILVAMKLAKPVPLRMLPVVLAAIVEPDFR